MYLDSVNDAETETEMRAPETEIINDETEIRTPETEIMINSVVQSCSYFAPTPTPTVSLASIFAQIFAEMVRIVPIYPCTIPG